MARTEHIDFRIKPGTRDGQRIRLAGKGNAGTNGVAAGIFSNENGAVMNFERRSGITGNSTPARAPTPPDQAPVAMTMTGADTIPSRVTTPSTRAGPRAKPVTSEPVRIVTPRSRARDAMAVVARTCATTMPTTVMIRPMRT